MVRELIVTIGDELEKEMSRYPDVDWVEVVRKAITKCIACKDILQIYDVPIDSF